ncbi:sensor histidine kinase [Mobilicoccus caccae]|uniref:Histidine kinase n=1 Tax=Mobilicoccus caccae TaxID=1859295 RepID=A0ABQ6IW26_9MICO|nr:sensor histidine kinase [Mobilicoccus caccae]GMA40919.1 histidine kinase [Mobilicoccus caccae]
MTHVVQSRTPGPRHAPSGPPLGRALAWTPYVLLALAFIGVAAVDTRPRGSVWFASVLGLTAVTVALRLWWGHRARSRRALVACFVLNLLLTLGLLTLSPLFGVYAFVGYLDAVAVFSGAAQPAALVAAASLNALAQSGGPQGALERPVLFALLLVVNGALAVFMVQVDGHRQRTVTRLEQALADLQEAERVNAELRDQVVRQARESGALEERQRISREIHDTVAQGLIALLRQIEAAAEATTVQDSRGHLGDADATARESLGEARRAVAALASPRLDETDLPGALRTLVAGWSASSGVTVEFEVVGRPVDGAHDADLLRVCQEALSNVARHARAARVDVTLAYLSGDIRLTVQDDGTGLPRPHREGCGLPGMRHRMSAAGGSLTLQTREGGGCVLTAAIPR